MRSMNIGRSELRERVEGIIKRREFSRPMTDLVAANGPQWITNFPRADCPLYEEAIRRGAPLEIRLIARDSYGRIVPDYFSVHCTGEWEYDSIFWQTIKWLYSGKIKDWPSFRFWTYKLPEPPKIDLGFFRW